MSRAWQGFVLVVLLGLGMTVAYLVGRGDGRRESEALLVDRWGAYNRGVEDGRVWGRGAIRDSVLISRVSP